ncbi:MAG: phosphotransferase [Micromonosporaceae bacterium]
MDTPAEHVARAGGVDALNALLGRVAAAHGLGPVRRYSVINVGYEDCNVALDCHAGRFVLKVFSSVRTHAAAARVVDVVAHAMKIGVRHPRLLLDETGVGLHTDQVSGRRYMVMEFVHGQTFHDLDRPPTDDELREVIAQAALIHSLDLDPGFVFDPWAVPNISALSETVRSHIDPDTMAVVDFAARRMRELDPRGLPHVLIHGDMTRGNILLAATGEVVVLDFAVANRYPRIQELAVIAANLMHGDRRPLRDRAHGLADMYDKHHRLGSEERVALERYTHAAVAMEFLGAARARFVNGDPSEETTRLLKLGRTGLEMVHAELAAEGDAARIAHGRTDRPDTNGPYP